MSDVFDYVNGGGPWAPVHPPTQEDWAFYNPAFRADDNDLSGIVSVTHPKPITYSSARNHHDILGVLDYGDFDLSAPDSTRGIDLCGADTSNLDIGGYDPIKFIEFDLLSAVGRLQSTPKVRGNSQDRARRSREEELSSASSSLVALNDLGMMLPGYRLPRTDSDSDKYSNVRQQEQIPCSSDLDELADGNLKSTLMFMNSLRKRYDSQLAPREMADGACQPGQTSSRPGSAHARYPPDRDDGPCLNHITHRPPTHGYRPNSGPPYGVRCGSTDHVALPGALGRQGEDSRAPAPPPGIISTTELDRNSASQRGVEERRPYLAGPHPGPPPRPRRAKPAPTCTPPPPPPQAQQAWTSSSSSGNTPNVPPKQFGASSEAVREAVSLTVEERLRSLLSSGGQQPQPMKLPPSGYQQPHIAHQQPPHQGQVNTAYHYDDGELLLPPPRALTDHGPRHGLENGALQDERAPGHHHQGSIGSEAELQTSYVPSQPSDRMSGVSRGQALHAPRPPQPGGATSTGPPLPPKSVGQPPRYQPPPQYSPFQRRPGDVPGPSGGLPPPNGPTIPTGTNNLRNMCNKLYTRDNQAPYNNPQQGSPSPYGQQQQQKLQPQQPQQQHQQQQPQSQQQWTRYGNQSGQQGAAPRTSPMGQSSSATSSHASGQGSSNHSPSSPTPRRPAPPHPQQPAGLGEYPADRRYVAENRLSSASNPSRPESAHAAQEKRLSSASMDRQKVGYSERSALPLPSSSSQKPEIRTNTNKGAGPDMYGGQGVVPSAASRLAAARLQAPDTRIRPGSSTTPGLRADSLELADLAGRGAGPQSAAAVAHHVSQMALKVPNAKWRDSLVSEEGCGNYSPSISSSRSVTPPLPPLSPDNTPPHTPPESPSAAHRGRRPLSNGAAPVGFLARTPDVVTSTALKKPANVGAKKKPARRAAGTPVGVKTWDGRGKRTTNGKAGKRGNNTAKPPRPPGLTGMLGDGDCADDDTLTNTSFTEADYATVHGATGSGALEVHEARIIRQQLEGLETMYHEILKLLGLDREYMPGSRRSISSTSSISRSGRPRMKRNHSTQHRSRDLKQVNKRFARLESHVVTLARSVAHLSSEMRTHNGLCTDVEEIKRELVRLKDAAVSRPPQVFLNEWERFRGWVPSLTNPKRVNKLTKFFGQEPPLLNIFLKKLGYEKYTTNFEQEKIGMIELPYMNEDRLQRIGIPMGPRLRILQEAQLCFRQENFDIYIV